MLTLDKHEKLSNPGPKVPIWADPDDPGATIIHAANLVLKDGTERKLAGILRGWDEYGGRLPHPHHFGHRVYVPYQEAAERLLDLGCIPVKRKRERRKRAVQMG